MSKDELRTLLAQARQQVWGEAATVAETFSKGYDVGWLLRATKQEMAAKMCHDIAAELREQAKKGTR